VKASIFRLLKAPLTWVAILSVVGVELVVVVGLYGIERARLLAIEKDVTYGTKSSSKRFWKFEMSGLRSPPALPAPASKIADGDEVIGIVVNGKPRAYWLKALKYPPWHIVNDVVDEIPVSVTFCDRTNCTRVYTDRQGSTPLDVNLGGLYGKEMVVKIGGVLYYQESGKPFDRSQSATSLPYADHPWERTTWRDWKERHPETDIFIGLGRPGPKP
jgi:Protein of unknown function (DUF3179)